MADECFFDLSPDRTNISMGLGASLDKDDLTLKRKYRWLLFIPNISAQGIDCLPPKRGARPGLSWKEMEVQHLTETIWYPWKPEWKPVNLVLYDRQIKRGGINVNPIFEWVKRLYNPSLSLDDSRLWTPIVDSLIKETAFLCLYDGCGCTIEKWKIENCYPSNVDWGELDMEDSNIVTVEIQLRYDRAYLV